MPGAVDQFRFSSYAQEVIFASGALSSVSEAVERYGWQRLMLCTNRSMRAGGQVGALESQLGDRLVAVFDRVHPHVQDVQVEEALQLAEANSVDAIIGMGGGSPLGMAKATAFKLAELGSGEAPRIPVIAIPSTYAGSEMTPVFGITQTAETPPRKVTVSDPRITPRLVLYDPQLTLALPAEMTASSGINALAHCIEALYSLTRNPLSTAAALSGMEHINHSLFRCFEDGQDLEARTEMLLGAHLAGFSLASVSMGLHHGLCHVLGGTAKVPHGIANSIILPHAMRFNADATAAQLLPAVAALGVAVNGSSPAAAVELAADRIYDLIAAMDLPQRLRDAGVPEADLPTIAQLGFQNRTVQNNPKPITDPIEIETLLREAW